MADTDAKTLKSEIQKQKSELKRKNEKITKLLAEIEILKSDVMSIQTSLAENEKLYRLIESADVMNKINESMLEESTLTIKDMEELNCIIKSGKLRELLDNAKEVKGTADTKVDTNINLETKIKQP